MPAMRTFMTADLTVEVPVVQCANCWRCHPESVRPLPYALDLRQTQSHNSGLQKQYSIRGAEWDVQGALNAGWKLLSADYILCPKCVEGVARLGAMLAESQRLSGNDQPKVETQTGKGVANE